MNRSGLLKALANQDLIQDDITRIDENLRLHHSMMNEDLLSKPDIQVLPSDTELFLTNDRQEATSNHQVIERC